LHAKVVASIGPGTVSAGKTWAGLLETSGLADFVGTPTAGADGNRNRTELPGGYYMLWTGMRTTKNDGRQHHGVGIRPTQLVTPTAGGITSGRDEVLERARKMFARRETARTKH
jgi:C-terminal processing protease CtpA/Prc